MPSDADLVYERALQTLPVVKARLPDDYFYAGLPLCAIDAVWSLGVNFKSVLNVAGRYCEKTGVPRFRRPDEIPVVQETVSGLVALLDALNAEQPTNAEPGQLAASDRLFDNRKPTSHQSGILKADAVRRFAVVLRDHGLERLEDALEMIATPAANDDIEKAIRAIPGQGSGISLDYFWMLAGDDSRIKPDTMVTRFLEETLGRKVKKGEPLCLLTLVSADLEGYNPHMTPRLLDHLIWRWQREEPANRQRALALVELLPKLEAEGFTAYKVGGGEKSMVNGQEVTHVSYPTYHPTLVRVFKAVDGVDPYANLLEDPSDVEPIDLVLEEGDLRRATRDRVLRYLAVCMRREKFGDGYIAGEFDDGRILVALQRLRDLQVQSPSAA